MSTNGPTGHGQNPYDGSNPYGQQNQNPYGGDQQPYKQEAPYGQPYGQQPPPYAEQPPYGEQQPYGQPGYGTPPQQPYGQPEGSWPHGHPRPGPYGSPVPSGPPLAPIGERLVARLIDVCVLLVPTLLLFTIFGASILYYVVAALLSFGYEAAMLLTQGGQTVGKKVMKLRVVDLASGGKPAENSLLIRAALYTLPNAVYCVGSLFALLNVLWPLWDKPYQQALHDKPAKTVVIKES
ncbi:RDD family protein [Kitasatospora sp. NPDC001527]|uniref:RDD family protein n=1 Tax=Kitasatospora sp. NPDC001527 TaxID=3154519 RepID=UPI0033164DD7